MAQPLRIFISSPGDVEEERRRAAIVVSRLAREFARFFEIKPVLWEYEPMLASGHFQDIIEPPSRSDIEVVILWSRLGTPLPIERYRGIDGRAPVTGTEWEFEDALRAHRERGAPDLLVYRKKTKGIAEFDSTAELEAAAQQRKALELFWDRYFGSAQTGFKAAFNLFTDRDEFEQMLESHLTALIRERLPRLAGARQSSDGIAWYQGSPYRGLEYFDLEHATIFFGRARAQRQVTEALARRAGQGTAFVLVLGMSGCGKSSLVRAGVLPELMTPGVVSGVGMWRHCVFRPSEGEGDLIGGLIRALAGQAQALPELLEGGLSVEQVSGLVREAPGQAAVTIVPSLKRAAERGKNVSGDGRLILVIDQMEEIFSLPSVDKDARERFMALVAALAGSGAVWVIGVMRSDFYHRAAELPELVRLAADQGSYLLTEPNTAEIEEMIRQPAAAAGLAFEEDTQSGERLDVVLQEAAAREPGALPLLEFALDQLYRKDVEEKRGSVLTFASYHELGELKGAVARHADEVCDGLPAEALAALPGVLRALVTMGSAEGRAVARAMRRDDIATTPARAAAIDRLVEARLLVGSGEAGEGQLRLAHDMLIASWPRLRDLVAEDRDFLRTRERVDQAAAEWERRGKVDDFLLPAGRSLAEAEDILTRRSEDLESRDRVFIETSVRRERSQRERRLRRARAIAAAMALLAVVAAGFGWYAVDRRAAAERNYEVALRAAQTLVRDVAGRLRNLGLPAASVRDILTSAESLYGDLVIGAASSPDLRSRQAETLMSLADSYAALGDSGAERKRAEAARAILLEL
ncbi:MAG TPA: AAA family ATPase, partial [Alphaproteobacteria bacterium]|nr:AAA family ATPase [Alphaproteobacteria bacterium]